MDRVRERTAPTELPQLSAYFQSGGLVDAVLNLGLPAPIDVQVSGSNLERSLPQRRSRLADPHPRDLGGVSDVYIPQDVDYPALRLDMDRMRASGLGPQPEGGGAQRDHRADLQPDDRAQLLGGSKSGNDYMLTVQYPENPGQGHARPCAAFRIRGRAQDRESTRLDAVTSVHAPHPSRPPRWTTTSCAASSTFTSRPAGEDLGRLASSHRPQSLLEATLPEGRARGRCAAWCRACARRSAASASACCWRCVLLYLILVAQFRSFVDPVPDSAGRAAGSDRRAGDAAG